MESKGENYKTINGFIEQIDKTTFHNSNNYIKNYKIENKNKIIQERTNDGNSKINNEKYNNLNNNFNRNYW